MAVAAAGFGGYTYYENQQMDPWLKANIAALASIETTGQGEGGTLWVSNLRWVECATAQINIG